MGSPDGLILLDPFPRRLDRIFDGHLVQILATFNDSLWQPAA
jgi:hypothetical protein